MSTSKLRKEMVLKNDIYQVFDTMGNTPLVILILKKAVGEPQCIFCF